MRVKWLYGVISLLFVVGCLKQSPTENERNDTHKSNSLTIAKKKEIQDFWTHYRQATKKRIAGSWQEAANGYSDALELNANHEDARYYLANMYLELNELDKAEENWNKLLEINPSSSRAHVQLGKLYLNHEAIQFFDLEKASEKFQKAIEINQDFLQPVLHLAEIFIIQGKYTDSREKLLIVLGSNDKSVEAWFLMGFIDYKNGDKKGAGNNFMKARELSIPQNPVNQVKGEGDTKTGHSMERAINQSIFLAYFKSFELESGKKMEDQMQIRYAELNNFIIQLQAL